MPVQFELHAPVVESPEAMAELRRQLAGWPMAANPVQYEAYYLAISAAVWRLVNFGVEDTFKLYGPRELASFPLVASGALIDFMVRTAYTRAMVEDDAELWRTIGGCGVAAPVHQWHLSLLDLPPELAAARLAEVGDPEELAAARCVLGRRLPGLIEADWLWQVPEGTPTIAHVLALVGLSGRPDLAPSIGSYLANRRNVLLSREPDPLLSLLVARSAEHPQVTLRPFEGFYGEETVVAAAAWHLEHDEPTEAHQLATAVRPLSRHANQAFLVAALAALKLGRGDEVARLRGLIDDRNCLAQLTIRIGETEPRLVGDGDLMAIMDVCTPQEPELFFRALRLLLGRKRLDLARAVCARRQGDFKDHAQLAPIIATVLGSRA